MRSTEARITGCSSPLRAFSTSCASTPFGDGNGRVARLTTTYLLTRAGYDVGRYISIEQLFYDTKDDYYAALGASTQ